METSKQLFYIATKMAAASLLTGASFTASAVDIVDRTAYGTSAAGITSTVNAFRTALGSLNANGECTGPCVPGSGRREINWDGVSADFSSPNTLPGDFFNQPAGSPTARIRGINFSTSGTFEVSAASGTGVPVLFGNHVPGFALHFAAFSGEKIFGLNGTNVMEVRFSTPGDSSSTALVSGFGAVFTDIEVGTSTRLEFYNYSGDLIHSVFAPGSGVEDSQKTLSFAGTTFSAPVVAMVKIYAGNCDLSLRPSGCVDSVAMDDFIFGEPIAAVPEASTAAMLIGGLAVLTIGSRARRQRKPRSAA
jgi:hypothetical protein